MDTILLFRGRGETDTRTLSTTIDCQPLRSFVVRPEYLPTTPTIQFLLQCHLLLFNTPQLQTIRKLGKTAKVLIL